MQKLYITAHHVAAVTEQGEEKQIPAETVIMCAGMRSRAAETERLRKYCPEVYVCGDAGRPRQIGQAVRDAYNAVVTLGLL